MKLSKPQIRVLANLVAGRDLHHGVRGSSAFGGLTQTVDALMRRGFISDGEITDAGRDALKGQQHDNT